MRILGIDPGLERTGYGVVETLVGAPGAMRLLEAGIIRTSAKDALAARLAEIHTGLAAVLAEFRPDAVAVEELYSHYKHPRTAILMGHARGIVLLAAAEAGVPVASYGATHIKKALVGSGHASKHQVQRGDPEPLRPQEGTGTGGRGRRPGRRPLPRPPRRTGRDIKNTGLKRRERGERRERRHV